jgi:hypothetical protein
MGFRLCCSGRMIPEAKTRSVLFSSSWPEKNRLRPEERDLHSERADRGLEGTHQAPGAVIWSIP